MLTLLVIGGFALPTTGLVALGLQLREARRLTRAVACLVHPETCGTTL